MIPPSSIFSANVQKILKINISSILNLAYRKIPNKLYDMLVTLSHCGYHLNLFLKASIYHHAEVVKVNEFLNFKYVSPFSNSTLVIQNTTLEYVLYSYRFYLSY